MQVDTEMIRDNWVWTPGLLEQRLRTNSTSSTKVSGIYSQADQKVTPSISSKFDMKILYKSTYFIRIIRSGSNYISS